MEAIYEVENRFYFKNKEEAYNVIPFLKSSLNATVEWKTIHYGLDLFKKDIILRISDAKVNNQRIYTLGYKEMDLGGVANIRKEYDEKITNGIDDSVILNILGSKADANSPDEVEDKLIRLGHSRFMSFTGNNLVGEYKPLDLKLKLMYCPVLEFPLLLEVEKEATTIEEAKIREKGLLNFVEEYKLEKRLINKEPPTLLYDFIKKK